MDLLIALQENPLATLDWLAERTKASKPTVAKRLAVLEGSRPNNMFMDDPEQGRFFSVAPLLDYHNLGFEYVGLIIDTDNMKKTGSIEHFAKMHPYTQYRARCYGGSNGLILQFRTPIGSENNILNFADKLIEMNIASKYSVLPSSHSHTVYSSLNSKGWNPSSLSWDFDWDEWFSLDGPSIKNVKPTGPSGKSLPWMTKKDVFLILEAMRNARRKNKEIMDSLTKYDVDFTPQTFSRRYSMVKEECFKGYRTVFDPRIFDIYNNILITGKAKKNYLHKLSGRLSINPIPFESTMRVSESELFWFVRLQASHLSQLISKMSDELEEMSVCLLDYNTSMIYLVDPNAFDEDGHGWIQDEQFMVTDVLKSKP